MPPATFQPMFPDIIAWSPDGGVRYLDQTRLPQDEVYRTAHTVEDMVEAIQRLRVRGAPLIGIAAAMGLTAAATNQARLGKSSTQPLGLDWLEQAADRLAAARPTAVNLRWAVDRMRRAG